MPSLLDELKQLMSAIEYGADPIEALSGHLCGPTCWHWETISEEQKERLMKAPWNRSTDAAKRGAASG